MSTIDFGKKLFELRQEKGLTLKEVGHRTGFTNSYISMLENGKTDRVPKPDTIKKLSIGLNIPFVELMSAAGYDHYEYESLTEAFGMDVLERNRSQDLYIKLKNNDDIFYNGYELKKEDKKLIYDLFERIFSMPNRKELYRKKGD